MAQPQQALQPAETKGRKAPAGAKLNAVPKLRSSDPAIAQEEIAVLAYSYWEARGGRVGGAEDDWFRAERDLRSLRRRRLL